MTAASQLVQRLLRRIELQETGWREGDVIPPEVELARSEGVSRMTLRAALKQLAASGMLARTGGKRRKITRPVPLVRHSDRQAIEQELGRLAKTLEAGSDRSLEQLCGRCPALLEQLRTTRPATTSWGDAVRELGQSPNDITIKPPTPVHCYRVAADARFDLGEVMGALNVQADAEVYWLLRVRHANESPIALQWCIVPARPWAREELVITKEDLVPGGLTRVYRSFGIRRDFATASFRSHRASPEEAQLLKLDVDAALIEECRVSYALRRVDGSQQLWPYEYLLTLYTDRVRLHSAWSEIETGEAEESVAKPRQETTESE